MKKDHIVSGAIFSIFILVFTPVMATLSEERPHIRNDIIINEIKINKKELLFQVILNISNNIEIQKIILKSEMRRDGMSFLGIRFSRLVPQIITKDALNRLYLVGMMFSKNINKSKMHSMITQYQIYNQNLQKEVDNVIEKNPMLKAEMTQLSSTTCDCENNMSITSWNFPIICELLQIMAAIASMFPSPFPVPVLLVIIISIYGLLCF
jgi:hypothetical protein